MENAAVQNSTSQTPTFVGGLPENARLKKAVAELIIDKIILKEVAEGKY
jgi:hypothetical protein